MTTILKFYTKSFLCAIIICAVGSKGSPDREYNVYDTEEPYHNQYESQHNPGYSYEYKVSDPNTGDFKTQHEERTGDTVRGSYSLMEPDGSKRIVEYTADSKNGFKAIVKREPPAGKIADFHNPTVAYEKAINYDRSTSDERANYHYSNIGHPRGFSYLQPSVTASSVRQGRESYQQPQRSAAKYHSHYLQDVKPSPKVITFVHTKQTKLPKKAVYSSTVSTAKPPHPSAPYEPFVIINPTSFQPQRYHANTAALRPTAPQPSHPGYAVTQNIIDQRPVAPQRGEIVHHKPNAVSYSTSIFTPAIPTPVDDQTQYYHRPPNGYVRTTSQPKYSSGYPDHKKILYNLQPVVYLPSFHRVHSPKFYAVQNQ